ncbi:DUF2061 domain-containing protein [uncultured Algibacter sp.]|uniref:DUF2061 domain-containing protein n=1 Tax=uncultured Algibacter sp. TaxID=298659 RepID=UPI00261B2267|nr:DUF2061 domain-containing protein [uncultured Algibacter sp.]
MIAQMLLKSKEKSSYKDDSVGEKPIRSVAKALSWRVIGTLDTLIVSYILTGEISIAASIASIDFLTKMVLYFFHERIWNAVKWGK